LAIEIHNLSFSYFDEPVIEHVNMVLEEGQIHVLLGPNGSGKTTLALAIAGVITPATGTVRVGGRDPASKGFDRSRVQLAFQFPEEQMFEVNVESEIAFGLKNFGMGRGEIRARSEWAMASVGLPAEMLSRPPDELSYGEMRKVALASVVALKPAYLLLDEPLAGLDWDSRRSIIDCLETLKNEGVTSVVLTHEPDLPAEVGDTVTLIAGGTLRSGPLPVEEFFYSTDVAAGEADLEHLPDTVRVLRRLRHCGVHAPGRPTREPDIITTILRGVRS
jgi:energy-coupling factor transporter ATP-binding protein EcfA2